MTPVGTVCLSDIYVLRKYYERRDLDRVPLPWKQDGRGFDIIDIDEVMRTRLSGAELDVVLNDTSLENFRLVRFAPRTTSDMIINRPHVQVPIDTHPLFMMIFRSRQPVHLSQAGTWHIKTDEHFFWANASWTTTVTLVADVKPEAITAL